MLSRRELSGLWGQLRKRSGWSQDIGKSKWRVLHGLICVIICVALVLPAFVLDMVSPIGPAIMAITTAVIAASFNGSLWQRDQRDNAAGATRGT